MFDTAGRAETPPRPEPITGHSDAGHAYGLLEVLMSSIHIPPSWKLPERLATPESVYLNRRELVAALGLGTVALSLPARMASAQESPKLPAPAGMLDPALPEKYAGLFPAKRNPAWSLGDRPITAEAIAGRYNNFYEFTTTKQVVWELAQGYPVDPWKVEIKGLVKKEKTLGLEDILKVAPLEERLYRFRCVEAWAMQVPWSGYPLANLIKACEPLPSAKYVRFVSFEDPDRLPGQKNLRQYRWPYYEALRMDEATNPVAFVALGSYGHALPMQHGAPWRLALPWKYGYKSAKSVVRIEFTKKRPRTFWNDSQPSEYGFFSNVNPEKPHPRWSQARERDIGTGDSRPTLLYNGYAEQVGGLYSGRES